MNIGEISKAANIPTKTVRYYADINLVTPSSRSAAGYRQYDQAELEKLIFVRRARSFGFSIDECRELLGLYEDTNRASYDVKLLTLQRIDDIKTKMKELKLLHDELVVLADSCQGDGNADCPIIDGLSKSKRTPKY
jgi:Cu(I)-responsive transcriptional regulator